MLKVFIYSYACICACIWMHKSERGDLLLRKISWLVIVDDPTNSRAAYRERENKRPMKRAGEGAKELNWSNVQICK